MVNGWAAPCGEEKFDFSEAIARFGDILDMEGPLVEIGARSVFGNRRFVAGSSQRGNVATVGQESVAERLASGPEQFRLCQLAKS